MPQYMIIYAFKDNEETVQNCCMFWAKEELNYAVSIICKTLHGHVEIYKRYTENNASYYKYSRTVEYTMKGGV